MVVVNIPSQFTYSNLYTLSGIDAGTSLLITNNTSSPAFIVQASVPPLASSDQFPLLEGETFLIHANADPIWIRGGTGPIIVQKSAETVAPYRSVDLPHDIYTSNIEGRRRLKVDSGQTGFFDGREFRTFFEFDIPSNQVRTFKFVSPINFILFEQSLTVDSGSVRFQAFTGSSEVASFNTPLPIIGKNRMTTRPIPFYTPVITVNTTATTTSLGGSISGGTVVESFRVVAANATAQQRTVGGFGQSERGLPPGTFYLRIHNFSNGSATGDYVIFWEERP
jgi:hypothetical protein